MLTPKFFLFNLRWIFYDTIRNYDYEYNELHGVVAESEAMAREILELKGIQKVYPHAIDCFTSLSKVIDMNDSGLIYTMS